MRRLSLFVIALYVFTSNAHAASPRDELKQLTAQLQSNPSDTALRERIIKLARTIRPAPIVSEAARGSFVEGTTITKAAKNPTQLSLAVQTFQKAIDLAPWWGEAYYNLAVVQEMAGNYDAAERALAFYILTEPDTRERRAATDKIHSIRAKAKLAVLEDVALVKKLDGVVFFRIDEGRHLATGDLQFRDEEKYQISGNMIIHSRHRLWKHPGYSGSAHDLSVGETREIDRYTLKGRTYLKSDSGGFREEGVISKDGQQIVETTTHQGEPFGTGREYLRAKSDTR